MSYIHTYGGVYIRTPNCRCSQFPSACPPSCQLHLGVGWTPPSAACREDTRQSCYTCTDIRTYVRVYGILTHTNCNKRHCFSLGHSLEWLPVPDGLSLQFTHTCLQVSELFIGLSKLSLQRLRTHTRACTYRQTGRQAGNMYYVQLFRKSTDMYVCMYVHSCAHSYAICCVRTYEHAHCIPIRTFMHVQYIHTYVHVCTRCTILHKT